ncbi:uncharacterized protein BJ212DRAFT_1303285 [Suillus subaureus]|uniref:Uncharacterized protein n=1 Tax=Suillus subaureus TaxID=48587 RepID=A0A9P7E0L5_9AGAM|nr:uncharacterized protein BJ212DRAFT_1303285 [Suillus subaureus]KAG1807826.1 hypothetical protein BJ212DRAFT_1303285 [Suillus subaureus]
MPHNVLGLCFLKIKEDKQHAKDAQDTQEADLQHGIDRIASIEAAMELEQGIQVTAKAKPVKPHARPVKKKTDRVGAASELTSGSLPVPPAPAQSQGGMKGQDAGDMGEGDVEAVGNKVAKLLKKIKKVHEAISATILGSDQQVKETGTDKEILYCHKKFGLTGKVNNWRTHMEPETKSKVSPVARPETEPSGGSVLSVTTLKTSQTVATTVSLAKDPPLSLMDSSDNSISDNGEDGGNEEDGNGDNEDFEEHLSTNVKGKVGMKIAESSDDGLSNIPVSTPFNLLLFSQQADIVRLALEQAQQPHAVLSMKRTIKEARLIGSSEDNNQDNNNEGEKEEEFIIDPMLVNKESSSITKVPEQMCTTTKTSVTVTGTEKPNPPKKLKLEPILPTIPEPSLMSADMATQPKSGSAQPKLWSIKAENLHPALQAIFDIAFPGMNYNVQPKGPIMGLELAASLLKNWAFLYEDPENCDPNKIYQSVFMIEMIKSAHINATAGFLNVPALDTDTLQVKGMQAIITASAAALKCTFNFSAKPKKFANDFSTGTNSVKGSIRACKTPLKCNKSTSKDTTTASVFSEANCSSVTLEYYESLKRRGVKYTMDTIALVQKWQEMAQDAPSQLKPMGRHALLCK